MTNGKKGATIYTSRKQTFNFAVFNGADSFVCVGAGLLMLALILEIIAESKAEKAKLEAAQISAAHTEDAEEE